MCRTKLVRVSVAISVSVALGARFRTIYAQGDVHEEMVRQLKSIPHQFFNPNVYSFLSWLSGSDVRLREKAEDVQEAGNAFPGKLVEQVALYKWQRLLHRNRFFEREEIPGLLELHDVRRA